ncbi:UMP kinase [Candidatus Paracaedibacter symbiosus]|uniref:UMP kinase n=1 Tax=Candidatus Paracaedibacter symbiosus TaxID=244582 RepID=UPI000509D9D5|nr:UMP kinase [Candidatus Paracaedibacter symbiosus]
MLDHQKYKRVLLKISGEALSSLTPGQHQGINQGMLNKVANDIRNVVNLGIDVCIVIGGGNIYRGVSGSKSHGIDRATSDHMGMLATVINALALQNAIEHEGMLCRVMTAIPMQAIGEFYIRRRAIRHMEKGRVVIFAAGTGNPFFTTDTAAALRALEMGCDLLLKATKVDGVYDKDPKIYPDAIHYDRLSYSNLLSQKLEVMDATAVALVQEHNLPLAVFSIYENDSFLKVLEGTAKHTLVTE